MTWNKAIAVEVTAAGCVRNATVATSTDMPEASVTSVRSPKVAPGRLPILALLALSMASFLTILTEALPAGLLPQIGSDLSVTEAMAGQMITVYAVGSLLAAIPLMSATRTLPRRPLLIAAIMGFAVANTVTALVDDFAVVLVARFIGGVAAGLLWASVPPYAVRLVPTPLAGRALAIAMAGTPVALAIGIPAGTFLGLSIGWRPVFGLLTLIAIVLVAWVLWKVPDLDGEKKGGTSVSLRAVLVMPGIRPVLFATLAYIVAHNVLYTYIAPLLESLGVRGQTDRVLLTFGLVALASVGIVGATVDRWLRPLTIASIVLFLAAAILLTIAGSPPPVYLAAALWGLGFGGVGTLFMTAFIRAAGPAADIATSMVVTTWNVAIAGGAVLGGLVLEQVGIRFVPAVVLIILLPALAVAVFDRAFARPPILAAIDL